MRYLLSLTLTAAFAFNPAAAQNAAAPVTVVISEPLQKALAANYGQEEAAVLQQTVNDSLMQAMKRAGLAQRPELRSEVLISDARPSHPTRHQQSKNPSIDPVRSISLGGATLSAVLRDAAGHELDRVSYDHYASSLAEASASLDPWSDARLTINRFADQVAESYRRHLH